MNALLVRTVVVASLLTASVLHAQRPESGAFVVRLGSDTIALEQYTRTGNRIEGDLLSRVPQTRLIHWIVTLSDEGKPRVFEYFPHNIDGSVNPRGVQKTTLTFGMDSITRETQWADSAQTRKFLNDGTVMPSIGTAIAMYELGTRWMRATRRDSANIRYMGIAATNLPNPSALRMWRDSVRFDFFGSPMSMRVDNAGRILSVDGSRTTLKMQVERVPSIDIAGISNALAARERAGSIGTPSPRDTTQNRVGVASLWIDYGRPSLRGRNVWVNGVLGDTLWRTGANAATQFRTDVDLSVGGAHIPAGTYTIWTHARRDGTYQLVFNRQTGQWGTIYDPAQDLVRVPLTRKTLDAPVERFTISVEPGGSSGSLRLMWGTTELSVSVSPR